MQRDEQPDPDDKTYDSIRFGDFKSYMDRKKRKLKDQEQLILAATSERSQIFKGLIIHVNGYTRPSHSDLKKIIAAHGGDFQHYLSKSRVTHIIASNLTNAKIKEFRAYKVVRPEWVLDSVEAGQLLPWQNYRLNSPMEVHQKELHFQTPSIAAATETTVPTRDASKNGSIHDKGSMDHLPQDHHPIHPMLPKSSKGKEVAPITGSNLNSALLANDWARENSSVNPEFLDKYYTTSRLHYLSMWKAELKSIVTRLRIKHSSQIPKPKIPRSDNSKIMHVDFDCFFASVGIRDRPHLRDKPVAVSHSKGVTENASGAVASCNYEARKYGVRNGTTIGHARNLCPGLEVIPYEFDKYKEVSEIFYEILFGYADELEPVSIDEAIIDVTSSMTDSVTENDMATRIRSDIRRMTGCEASIGCGSNILLARLATKTAKPCGQYFVESDKVLEFLMPISIRDLPGIGYAMEDKMNSMNVETIGDLRKYQMPVLQEKFGKKTGETLYKFARGIDDRPLSVGQPRQSVSAEVSWGVRFENDEQVNDFVLGLCKEVEKRLHNVGCKGRSITMKIKRRQLEAMEASMHLGHGMCDNFSKSITLDRHTDDALVIFDEAIKLLKSHEFAAGDIRGLGVQIQKLDNDMGASNIEGRKYSSTRNCQPYGQLSFHKDGQSILPYNTVTKAQQDGTSKPPMVDQKVDDKSTIKPDDSIFQASSSTSTSRKPPMEVERQAFIELPQDIRSELERVYELVFLEDNNEQDAKVPSDKLLSMTAEESCLHDLHENEVNKPLHEQLSQNMSEPDVTPKVEDKNNPPTQFDLPPWSQLDPTDLLAMPDNMRARVLKEYSEKDSKSTSKVRKGSPVSTTRSPKLSKTKRNNGQKTPSNAKSGADQTLNFGGKRSFTLTQMFPPNSPSKRLSTRDAVEEIFDWDPNVLSELPADIRAELLDEHRRQRGQNQRDLQNKLDNARVLASMAKSNPRTTVSISRPALMGQTEISAIRDMLRAWVSAFASEPEEDDVETVSKYLLQLARVRDFYQAQLVVQYLTMLINNSISSTPEIGQSWKIHLDKLKMRLDDEVYTLYNCNLKWC